MMKKKYLLFVFLLLVLSLVPAVSAQGVTPQIIKATMPMDGEVRAAVEAWLLTNAPAPYQYWAITYFEQHGSTTLVSLAALGITDPTQKWYITDHAAWTGTVVVYEDGAVYPYSIDPEPQQDDPLTSAMKNAVPVFAGGGGSHLRFPWEQGGSMMYGERGVHAAGGGGSYATGFSAVDFLGGDDLGSGVASDKVFAATSGIVDYRCSDGTTTLVRLFNEELDEYYIYAHLLDNENLVQDHEFNAGSLIGRLRYGTFDDDCGWAEQQDDHYHLHFGFQPASGAFRMEGCILSTSTQKWNCGTREVSTGEFLVGGGGGSGGGSGLSAQQPSFWDYFVVGIVSIWQQTVVSAMPDHSAMQFTSVIYDTVKVAIKIVRVMVYSNVNLGPMMTVIFWGFSIKIVFGLAEFVVFLFKAWKSLVPVLGS